MLLLISQRQGHGNTKALLNYFVDTLKSSADELEHVIVQDA